MSEPQTASLPDKPTAPTLGWIHGISFLSKLLIASGILFVFAGVYGSALDNVTTLRVGTNLWIGYQPLRIAQTAGRLDRQIALLEGRSTSAVMEALKIGTADAAALTLDEAVRVASDGVPLSVVLVLDISDGADVVVARSAEVANAGPRGKRVGVEVDAVGALVLHRWLAINDLQVADVTVVNIAAPDHPRAFAELNVDFLVTYEPIASKSLPSTAVIAFDSSQIPNEIVDVLVVRRDRLRAQLKNIRELKKAWFFGTAEMARRTPLALTHLLTHQDLTSGEIEAILRKLRFPDERENAELLKHGRLKEVASGIDAWLASSGLRPDNARNLTFSDALVRNQLE